MSNNREKPQPERNDHGRKIITLSYLKRLCVHQGLYETPLFNKYLYLHYTGFHDIRNLDEYTNIQALFLENNLIEKIEGLSELKSLRCLYLQNNNITKIENLGQLTELKTLNLSQNKIEKIENLSELASLTDLDLSHNRISSSAYIRGLTEVPSITSLDLSYNSINDADCIFDIFSQMINLGCLYLKNNNCIRQISNYRKMLVAKIPSLKHLDEKPVFEVERLGSEAWFLHGKDAEMEVRKKYYDGKDEENCKYFREYAELEMEGIRKKEELRRKLEEERLVERRNLEEYRLEVVMRRGEGYEVILEEIEKKENELAQPIGEDSLKISGLKEGKFSYKSGELDKYGNLINHANDKENFFPEDENNLLPISDLQISELEEKLIETLFNFESAYSYFKTKYLCSIDALQLKWSEYECFLQTNPLDELD